MKSLFLLSSLVCYWINLDCVLNIAQTKKLIGVKSREQSGYNKESLLVKRLKRPRTV